MPIYEYACDACGKHFEKLLRRSADQSSLRCPSCDSAQLSQQYSSFAATMSSASASQPAMAGSCPSGMCRTPGLCGRN